MYDTRKVKNEKVEDQDQKEEKKKNLCQRVFDFFFG